MAFAMLLFYLQILDRPFVMADVGKARLATLSNSVDGGGNHVKVKSQNLALPLAFFHGVKFCFELRANSQIRTGSLSFKVKILYAQLNNSGT